jgi:hypothetical protein
LISRNSRSARSASASSKGRSCRHCSDHRKSQAGRNSASRHRTRNNFIIRSTAQKESFIALHGLGEDHGRQGFTKLLFDEANHRLLGGGIVGTHAGDLIGEVCLAVEMGCDPVDVGKTIHPHPTLCESIGMTAEVFEGVCTDLPPARKR